MLMGHFGQSLKQSIVYRAECDPMDSFVKPGSIANSKAFLQAMVSTSSLSTIEGPLADTNAITSPFSFQTIALIPVSSRSPNNAASKLSLNQEDGGGHHTSTDCFLPLQCQV